jgi:hypothetical protein
MTKAQRQITRALLETLHDLDGGQAQDAIVHQGVRQIVGQYVPLAEFNDALEFADRNGWIITIRSPLNGTLRKLSDAGAAARLEMK